MAKFIRYALATVCFAASFGCLALWWRSESRRVILRTTNPPNRRGVICECGYATVFRYHRSEGGQLSSVFVTEPRSEFQDANLQLKLEQLGQFGATDTEILFPLRYPALLFALAGVAALRFRRQFSIRSALIATTVVAALFGMVAVL